MNFLTHVMSMSYQELAQNTYVFGSRQASLVSRRKEHLAIQFSEFLQSLSKFKSKKSEQFNLF